MSGDGYPLPLPVRFAAGASEATTLFKELRKPLLRYLVGLGLTSDEAQDVVQDAFLNLHRSLESGVAHENARAWLFSVAHTLCAGRIQREFDLEDGQQPALERGRVRQLVLNRCV